MRAVDSLTLHPGRDLQGRRQKYSSAARSGAVEQRSPLQRAKRPPEQQPIPSRRRRAYSAATPVQAAGRGAAAHTSRPINTTQRAPRPSQPLASGQKAKPTELRVTHTEHQAFQAKGVSSRPLHSALVKPGEVEKLAGKGKAQAPSAGKAVRLSKRTRSYLWLAARIVISAGLLYWLLTKAHLALVAHALSLANPAYHAFGLGLGVVTVVVSAWQWQVLLGQERIRLSLPLLTGLYFLGITFNQLLPTSIGGDVAKATYVARESGRAVSATGATLMARVVGLGAMLLTGLPFALAGSLLIPRLGWGVTAILGGVTLAYVGALLALFASPRWLALFGVERVRRLPFGRKLLELAESLASYRLAPAMLAKAFGVSALFYLVSNCNFYLYGLALRLPTPFWYYWAALPIASLATMLPVSLNGYGVRGASFVVLFGMLGASAAGALALSTTMGAQMLLFALVGGLVFLALNHRAAPKSSERANVVGRRTALIHEVRREARGKPGLALASQAR